MIKRCRACRFTTRTELPALNKKVIYLDQFAISNLYKASRDDYSYKKSLDDFWKELLVKIRKVSILQQAIFPHSNIHRNETIISPFAEDLRLSHELLGGDVSLLATYDVQHRQLRECFAVYLAQREPKFSFEVDDILSDERNVLLPDMHITVSSDYSVFADGIRDELGRSESGLTEIAKRWIVEKQPFHVTFQAELEAFGPGRLQALRHVRETAEAAMSQDTNDDNVATFLDAINHTVAREFRELKLRLEKEGFTPDQASQEVLNFWHWPGNQLQPYHRISAYMFAALARKFAAGQKRLPSRGFMNDVSVLAAYAPYLDAMFIDNECAALIVEASSEMNLPINASIFSQSRKKVFMDYIDGIIASTPDAVRSVAVKIY